MNLRHSLLYTAAIVSVGAGASAAQASTLSATFTTGAVAKYTSSNIGTNANQTDTAKLFSELNITSVTISQTSTFSTWSQGNDTAVTVTVNRSGGLSSLTFQGTMNWVSSSCNGNGCDYIGITMADNAVNDGYPALGTNQHKTYILQFSQSTLSLSSLLPDNIDGSANFGNAAFSALDAFGGDTTAPVVTASQSFSYAENQAANATVATVAATDATGVTAFRFSATGTQTSADGYYSISNAGVVKITAAGAAAGVANNDYEITPNAFTYGVQAGDAAGNWSAATNISLNVTNLDDTAPVVTASQTFNYAENQIANAAVATVAATDAVGVTAFRFGANNSQTSADGFYTIDNAGVIKITAAGVAAGVAQNDYETTPNAFTYAIQAGDAAGNWSAATNITLNVTDVNDTAPAFTNTTNNGGTPTYTFNYAENKAVGATLGTVAAAGGTGARTFSITGGNTDGWYQIDATTGVISLTTTGAASLANDYEQAPNTRALTVQVTDAANQSATIQVTLNETDVDDTAPVITGPSGGAGAGTAALSVNEGQTAVTKLTASEGVTWTITGGNDSGKFNIATDGTITFSAAPSYDNPSDSDTNNTYQLTVTATDPAGNITTQTITVTVLKVDNTAPVITGPSGGAGAAASAITVNENQTAVTKVTANEPVTWAITGGTEAGKFNIATDGTITFKAAPDYEAPTDADTNNTYLLTLTATDAAGNVATQTMTVTVANLDDTAPLITGPSGGAGAAASAISVNEGQTAVTKVTANETVTWSIVGGADASKVAIAADGTITFLAAPDYENPADADHNNTYVVTVQARDAAGNLSTQTITITVLNVDEITQKLNAIAGKLRADLRNYAFGSLQDMLSFNEGLMQDDGNGNGDCGNSGKRKGVHGSVNANQSGQNIDLKMSQQLNACTNRIRVYFDMGLAASSMLGNDNLRALGSIRAETLLSKDVTVGLGLMGSFASDSLNSFANSTISDESLQGNLYVRARLSDKLRAGAFGSFGHAWYRFGLHDDGFNLAGRMTGDRYAYGAVLSGDMNLGGLKVTTDVALSRATETLGNASLSADYKGESRSGIGFHVGAVDATRLSVPAHIRLLSRGENQPAGKSVLLTFSPGLLCEDKNADASTLQCGYQLGGKLLLATGPRDRVYVDARHEDVSGTTRQLYSVGYAHRFGPMELGVTVDQNVTAYRGGDSRAMLRIRYVGR
jgi:hypothetical protein